MSKIVDARQINNPKGAIVLDTAGNILLAVGTTVPGAVAGYANGGLFWDLDASAGSQLWINAGTTTSASFVAMGAPGSTLASLIVTALTLGTLTATVGASTAAAGTTVADATALPSGTALIYPTTAADDTKGVKLTATDQVTGRVVFVGNGVSNKILKVYGPSGAVVNGAAADAAFSSGSGKSVLIVCLSGSGNTWLALG